MVQNAITNFVALLDNIMIGQLGTEEMSGVAIINPVSYTHLDVYKRQWLAMPHRDGEDVRNILLNEMSKPYTQYALPAEAMAKWDTLIAVRSEVKMCIRDRDDLLHTIACKAAIKAGWHTEAPERDALVREVLSRDDLKYCPHGRPICMTLRRSQLERQCKRA